MTEIIGEYDLISELIPVEQRSEVWTRDRALKARLYDLCLKYPDEFVLADDTCGRLMFIIPEEEQSKGV